MRSGTFENHYEVVNLWALKVLLLNKLHIFQCMGEIFCVKFQWAHLKCHTKHLIHSLCDAIFIWCWKFKSLQIEELIWVCKSCMCRWRNGITKARKWVHPKTNPEFARLLPWHWRNIMIAEVPVKHSLTTSAVSLWDTFQRACVYLLYIHTYMNCMQFIENIRNDYFRNKKVM